MTELLHPELLDVDGRVYRVLATSPADASGRRPALHAHQPRQRHYEAEDDAGEEEGSWGVGGEAAGGGGGGGEEQASVPIRQEGDSFVARMRLDSEVRSGSGCEGGRGVLLCWQACGACSPPSLHRHTCNHCLAGVAQRNSCVHASPCQPLFSGSYAA